jgi:ketosteroid isomerase-like protein
MSSVGSVGQTERRPNQREGNCDHDRYQHRDRTVHEAFRLRAPEKLVDIIADDCVMEGVGPAPDGNRWTGYDECLAGWQGLIREPDIRFEVEHVDVDGDRAVIRWRLHAAEAPFRGVNLMRVRDGKIVEALGYGKRP